jgi:glycerate kinase
MAVMVQETCSHNHLTEILAIKRCSDPLGRMIDAHFGLIDNGQTAVIEMATASGLRLLRPDEYDPLHASSYGTGELIKAALDKGCIKDHSLCRRQCNS